MVVLKARGGCPLFPPFPLRPLSFTFPRLLPSTPFLLSVAYFFRGSLLICKSSYGVRTISIPDCADTARVITRTLCGKFMWSPLMQDAFRQRSIWKSPNIDTDPRPKFRRGFGLSLLPFWRESTPTHSDWSGEAVTVRRGRGCAPKRDRMSHYSEFLSIGGRL